MVNYFNKCQRCLVEGQISSVKDKNNNKNNSKLILGVNTLPCFKMCIIEGVIKEIAPRKFFTRVVELSHSVNFGKTFETIFLAHQIENF